jgi:hypothetical protein
VLPSLPPDGILLQFPIGLTWYVSVPDIDAWFAALAQRGPAASAQT